MTPAIPSLSVDPQRMSVSDVLTMLSAMSGGNGTVDIATIGPDSALRRAATFVVALSLATLNDGRRPFSQVVAVLPPTRAAWDYASAIKDLLAAIGAPADVAESVLSRCSSRHLAQFDSTALLGVLETATDATAVYVDSAALYRVAGVAHHRLQEAWVSHLSVFAAALAKVVVKTQSYIFLDAGHFSPMSEGDLDMLRSVDAGLVGISAPLSPAGMSVSASLNKITDGNLSTLSTAMAAIQSFDGESALEKIVLRSLAFARSGRAMAAWALIAPVWEEIADDIADVFIPDIARVASASGHLFEARRILARLQIEAAGPDALENALAIARDAGDSRTHARLRARLQSVYPASRALADHLLTESLMAGDYSGTIAYANDPIADLGVMDRAYWVSLATALSDGYTPLGAVEAMRNAFKDREGDTILICARVALSRRLYIDALDVAFAADPNAPQSEGAIEIAVEAIEGTLLQHGSGQQYVLDDDALASAVSLVAATTARHPYNTGLRIAFARLLSAEVVGARGDAVLAILLLAQASSADDAGISLPDAPLGPEERAAILDRVIAALSGKDTTIIPGLGELPDDVTVDEARGLIPTMRMLLQSTLDAVSSELEFRPMQLALHAAILTAKRAGVRHQGAEFIRAAAAHLTIIGFEQDARDLVDHMLLLSGDDPAALRAAWMAYADTYQRTGDVHEALVGAVLGSSLNGSSASAVEAWHEGYLVARLLRDVGLFAQGESLLRKLVETLGARLPPAALVRADTCRLSIQARRFLSTLASDQALLELLAELAVNLRRVIEVHDEVAPALILIVQVAQQVRVRGLAIDDEIVRLIAEAGSFAPSLLRPHIDALGERVLTLDAIARFAQRLMRTRFASDVAYDISTAAMLARRVLTHGSSTGYELVAVIDLLADRALVATKGSPLSDMARLNYAIESLQSDGIELHMLALDEHRHLVHVTVPSSGGARTHVVESAETFSALAFAEWQRRYPYGYPSLDTPDAVMSDAVRRSMKGIGIGEPPGGPAIVVADIALQKLPLNILRVGDEFLGDLQAVCSAPSLDWLSDCAPTSLLGSLIAWVPDPPLPDDSAMTLGPLADRLSSTFEEYGVVLHRDNEPPRQMRGAALAIVAAHGGIVPDDRFFQVVRSDGVDRWTARELSERMGDTGLVVLFVCNSGRLDEQPWGRATIGLARHFLANGCQSVVASPWPLFVGVPPRWLPPFLAALAAGSNAITAVHEANVAVSGQFSGNAVHAHAMHLYGNPMVKLGIGTRKI